MLSDIDRESSIPLHLQVRQTIRDCILQGELSPGEALPSLREMAGQAGVNKLTMLKAVDGLKNSGWLVTVRGKGIFVSEHPPRAPEENFDLGPRSHSRFFEGAPVGPEPEELADGIRDTVDQAAPKDVFSFGAVFPPWECIPTDAIRLRQAAVLKERGSFALGYTRTRGLEVLAEQLRAWFPERRLNLHEDDEILITGGAQQAIMLTLQVLVRPGETVLVESPGYLGVIQACRMLGIAMESVPLDKCGIDLDRLETRLKRSEAKLLFTVPNFQNPSGITMTETRRRRVHELTRRYGVTVLEDDTYGDLRFTGKVVMPIKGLPDSSHVVYVSTFSKSVAPGLRLGYMVARKELMVSLRRMKEVHDVSSSSLSQYVVARMLESGMYARHLRKTRRAYRKRRDAMVGALRDHLPEQARFTEPKGGMHLWVVLPEEIDTMVLLKRALPSRILFSPGALFFSDRRGNNCMRLNFASNPPEKINEGIARLGELIRQS